MLGLFGSDMVEGWDGVAVEMKIGIKSGLRRMKVEMENEEEVEEEEEEEEKW